MKKEKRFRRLGLGALLLVPALVMSAPAPADALDLSYLNYLLRIRYLSNLYNLPARDLNGIELNEQYLEDQYVTAVSLDDVRLRNGHSADLRLRGTAFNHRGQIVGAEFSAWVDDGSVLTLRIDGAARVRNPGGPQLLEYWVSYESDEGWLPLCGTDEYGAPKSAIPLVGRWDYSDGTDTGGSYIADDRVFTFACEGFVLEKCVAAGYAPWSEVFVCRDHRSCEWVSLQPYHQACTRMLRADFCGNGVSYTEQNVPVALYDGLGIRVDSESWAVEAEWDEDGAICADRARIEGGDPVCAADLQDETCGDKGHFEDGILIISELPQ